jgi:ribose-phosphate pyrophosphokinase
VCIGVHALFAADAYHALLAAGPQRVVTCDTVPHVSNGISVVAPLATAVQELMEAGAP